MIKKEQLLEDLGFKFNGDGFECVGCPKGVKFTMPELDKMNDALFVATMRSHEKAHPVGFEKAYIKFGSEDKTPAVKKNEPPKEKAKVQVKKEPVVKKEDTTAPKVQVPVPIAAPALPRKLIDAGLGTVLVSPKKAFLAAGGTEQQFAKEINFAVQHLMAKDYLISCARNYPEYLVEAVKNIALTGLTLNPELKLGYLVPRKGKIYFTSSYMGKREIVNRTGHVKDSYATLVYEKDVFEVHKGTNPSIKHIPQSWGDRGELMGGYWVCKLSNGAISFDTMTKERIEEIKARSEAVKAGKGCPWDSDYTEMALKTVYNWAFKFMPKTGLSDDQIKALEIEAKYDNEVFEDWTKKQEHKSDLLDDGPADDHIQEAEEVK
jgi:recombination protein RecT